VLHIARDDLRDLVLDMQCVAENTELTDAESHIELKKGSVQ